MSLTVVCFSKDRSFQLAECLRTIKRFVSGDLAIHVLYSIRPEFEKSYQSIQETNPDVNFVREIDFGEQLRDLVAQAHEHVLLCCDDSLYYRELDMREVIDVMANKQVVSYHIMLHAGLEFCHPQNKSSTPPPLFMPLAANSQGWIRLQGELEWNYPWDLSSTVYRRADAEAMLDAIASNFGSEGISHPNRLEASGMKAVLTGVAPPNFMGALSACPAAATASAVVLNRVQDIFENPIYDETSQTVEELEVLFWEGRRFDDKFYGTHKHTAMHIGNFVLAPCEAPQDSTPELDETSS